MDDFQQKQIKTLINWKRFWIALIVLGGLGWIGYTIFVDQDKHSVQSSWVNDGLMISNLSHLQEKVIVTHLAYGPKNNEVIGALDKPLLVYNSASQSRMPPVLTKDELTHIEWRDNNGELAKRPPVGAKVRLIGYNAEEY